MAVKRTAVVVEEKAAVAAVMEEKAVVAVVGDNTADGPVILLRAAMRLGPK